MAWIFFGLRESKEEMKMITGDVFNVVIDAQTIALVDAWAAKTAFEPSRRQAVRCLLRQALKAHEARARAQASTASTTTAAASAGGGEVSA
jgi:hypothetical protein